MNKPLRKSANLSLDSQLLEDAKALEVNLSRAAETGLKAAVAKAKAQKWKTKNAAALQSSNDYVDSYGLPLDKYRQF